jgi:hypothetical protein
MIPSILLFMLSSFAIGTMIVLTSPSEAAPVSIAVVSRPTLPIKASPILIQHEDEPVCTDSDGDNECDEGGQTKD